MAGSRLWTQLSFLGAVLLLMAGLLDYSALHSAFQCSQLSSARDGQHASIHNYLKTSYILRPVQHGTDYVTTARRGVAVHAESERHSPLHGIDSPSAQSPFETVSVLLSDAPTFNGTVTPASGLLAVNARGLHAVCGGDAATDHCLAQLQKYEESRIQHYLTASAFSVHLKLTVNVVLADCGDSDLTTGAHELFAAAVKLFASNVRGRSTADMPANIRVTRHCPADWGTFVDNASYAIDVYKLLSEMIPNDVINSKQLLRRDVTLVVYFPPTSGNGLPTYKLLRCEVPENIHNDTQGFGFKESNLGLVVVGAARKGGAAEAVAINNLLIAQFRDLLGMPTIHGSDSVRIFDVPLGVTINVSDIHYNRPRMDSIGPWESRWIRLAVVEHALHLQSVAEREARFYCSSVWDWSTDQHKNKALFVGYNYFYDSWIGLAEAVADSKVDNFAYQAAVQLHRLYDRITTGEELQRPSYFPMEYRLAIYAPFWIPIIIPILHGALKESRRYRAKMNAPRKF